MKYLKEILVLISLVIIFFGCSPTNYQVVCGGGEKTKGTLSNTKIPRVEVLENARAAVQAPGTDQSGDNVDELEE